MKLYDTQDMHLILARATDYSDIRLKNRRPWRRNGSPWYGMTGKQFRRMVKKNRRTLGGKRGRLYANNVRAD